jgi:hypothetical protein
MGRGRTFLLSVTFKTSSPRSCLHLIQYRVYPHVTQLVSSC